MSGGGGMKPHITITGLESALSALNELPRRLRFKHFRIALNAGGGIVSRAAKGYARRRTGLLAKSIGVKVTIPDASHNKAHHGKPAYVIIGPKRKSGRMMRLNKSSKLVGFGAAQKALAERRKELAGFGIAPLAREKSAVALAKAAHAEAVYINPTRYAHLVEKGTKRTKAYPFLAPAIAATKGQVVQVIASKIRAGVEQEARALARS